MDRVRGGCKIVCSKDWFPPVPLSESMTPVWRSFQQHLRLRCTTMPIFRFVSFKDSTVNINVPHDLIVKHDTEQKHTECTMILGGVKRTMDWNETTMTNPDERMRSVDSGWSRSR